MNFRKIYLEHFERLPKETTVIFGQNHPTAFIDPIALGTHIDVSAWYMLRGDKFINKPVRWFLHKVHNLPIFRERDGGRAAVRKNLETMDFSTTKVVEGEPTVILSEGDCTHERRLRTIQRGTARMMFQAWKKDPSKPVAIVPVGTNYTAANDFRSSMSLTFGEPIYARDYATAFKEDSRETVDRVTEELHRRLRGLVIHVEDKKRDALADKLLPLVQREIQDSGFPPKSTTVNYSYPQWKAIEAINAMDTVEVASFEDDLDRYLDACKKAGVSDEAIASPDYGSVSRATLLVLTGPLAIFGLFINYPLAGLVKVQTDKIVKNPQFYASVRWVFGLVFFAVAMIILMLLTVYFIGWFVLLFPLIFGLTGYFFLLWYESFNLWRKSIRINTLSAEQVAGLTKMRTDILRQVGVIN